MHFLKKLIETPNLEDPAKNHMDVHRHFYRYSRGDFIGPALKVSQTKAKITLRGTHEYEDLVLELVTRSIVEPNLNFEVKGTLMTGSDISNLLTDLGLTWSLKKSTGQVKNYKADIQDQISKQVLLNSIDSFRPHSYLFLSYTINPSCKITTKKRIPQPSRKKVEDDDVGKRVQFCNGAIPNTSQNIKALIDLALPDFKSDIPDKWKSIILLNNYKITDIKLPSDVKDSRLLRIMATREGRLFRTLEIDGEIIEKQYSIVV